MDNFDENKWGKHPAVAPAGMFDQVRQRTIQRRIRMAQTQRQLVVGSVLLFVIGAFNIGIVLTNKEKQPAFEANAEQVLYETYFDNALNLSNEK